MRRQAPITVVRCPTPYGAVLRLPEEALTNVSPIVAESRKREVDREGAARIVRLQSLFDVVSGLKSTIGGPLSANKLIDYKDRLGVAKNKVGPLVDEALAAGVLVVVRRDANDRILDMTFGVRPVDGATL